MADVKQNALMEEREANINIDYAERKIYVSTNVAVVMNRLDRLGVPYYNQSIVDGQVWGRDYVMPFEDMSKVTKVGIFNCGRGE